MQRFKERLISRRNNLNLSQKELAEKSGVSERSIAGYEVSGAAPSGRILEKLARALDISPAWLMGGEDEPDALRENPPESDLDMWRRRAKAAEQELHDIRERVLTAIQPPCFVPIAPETFNSEAGGPRHKSSATNSERNLHNGGE